MFRYSTVRSSAPRTNSAHPRRRHRWALATLAVFAIAFPPTGTTAQAAVEPVADLGAWKPTSLPPDFRSSAPYARFVELFAEPGARLLYALGNTVSCDSVIQGLSCGSPWLAAYDLDTLRPRGAGKVLSSAGYSASYTDPASGALFLTFGDGAAVPASLSAFALRNGVVTEILHVDLGAALPGYRAVAITKARQRDVMWILAESSAPVPGNPPVGIAVAEVDISGAGRVSWTVTNTACAAAVKTLPGIPAGFGYVEANKSLYFGCGNPEAVLISNVPTLRGVGRLSTVADATGTRQFALFPRDGDFSRGDSFWDPGSSRLAMASNTSGIETVQVFDATTESYIGGVALGGSRAATANVDPVTGRYYGVANEPAIGLVVSDMRTTPISQGINVPKYARWRSPQETPFDTLLTVDPVARRLFVRYNNADAFRILRDDIPPYVPSPMSDLDANTMDVDEVPGVTRTTYGASAQGYGVRARQVGGAQGLVVNITSVDPRPFPVGAGTREIRGAYLNTLAITNGEASASVISADRDQANTQTDLNKVAPPGGSPPEWPYHPAKCFDFGSAPREDRTEDAGATCNADKQLAAAEAMYRGPSINGVGLRDATMRSRAYTDRDRGVVSEVTATADGIDIAGVVRIGRVVSTAKAWARGRPGTANTSYTRTVSDVVVNGKTICTSPCDVDEVQRQINETFLGRMRISFPQADPTYLHGSKGGYQALVRRSVPEQLQEQILNEQPNDRIEIPALVVTIYEDRAKPSRTIFEFAAVEAEARYGITFNGGGGGGGGGPTPGGPEGFGGIGGIDGLPGPLPGIISNPPGGGRRPSFGPGGGDGSIVGEAGRLILNGARRIAALFPLWAVLLAPIYLSARRWLLLQRATLVVGGKK